MAIVGVYPMHAIGGGQADGDRNTTVRYRVTTDSRSDGPLTVLGASGLPLRGEAYQFGNESDNYIYAQSAQASYQGEEQSLRVWFLDVTYNTQGLSTDPQQDKQDPLDWRPIVSTYSQKVRRPILRDDFGRLIASSAGEPYDPVQEKDETKFMLRIQRNVARHNPAFNATYKDAVNFEAFWGNPPLTVKVEVPGTASQKFAANGQKYYEETWEFAIEPRTWYIKLYDYGMYKIVDGKRKTIKDEEDNYLTSPVLLDGNGGVLAVGANPVELAPFTVYTPKRFADLGLPNSFRET